VTKLHDEIADVMSILQYMYESCKYGADSLSCLEAAVAWCTADINNLGWTCVHHYLLKYLSD